MIRAENEKNKEDGTNGKKKKWKQIRKKTEIMKKNEMDRHKIKHQQTISPKKRKKTKKKQEEYNKGQKI